MYNSRSIRREREKEEARKKRKSSRPKFSSKPPSKDKNKISTQNTKQHKKTQPNINPKVMNISYILCMTANFITILSIIVFPILRGQPVNTQSLFSTDADPISLVMQLAILILVNLFLFNRLNKNNWKQQSLFLAISGFVASIILLIQILVIAEK